MNGGRGAAWSARIGRLAVWAALSGCFLSIPLRGDLLEVYRKGILPLREIADFGGTSDWEGVFFDPYHDLVKAPDGSVFVADNRAHRILKFDQKGKFQKTFGRKGNGPGDFVYPDGVTILDHRYLVAGEYALNRRFTVWNMDGTFVKVVKTRSAVFDLVALRENRVAFYFFNQYPEKQNGYRTVISVVIKDIGGGAERVIKNVTLLDRSAIELDRHASADIGNFFGEVILAQTAEGDLAFGVTNRPQIEVYSPKGDLLRTFDLAMKPLPAAAGYIEEFKDRFLRQLHAKDESAMTAGEKNFVLMMRNAMKKFDMATLFDENLPLYRDIFIDEEGHFLIFKFLECQEECDPVFQVYAKDGRYVCETRIDRGKYALEIDHRFKRLCFTADGVVGLLQEREDEDEVMRLIKFGYGAGPDQAADRIFP